jgi:hypothetical protein
VAYLSRETVKWVKFWLEHAKIGEGPIFRRLIGRDEIGEASHPGSHRLSGDHASRRVEVAADAAAICREDQCGEVRNGESGGRHRPRRTIAGRNGPASFE